MERYKLYFQAWKEYFKRYKIYYLMMFMFLPGLWLLIEGVIGKPPEDVDKDFNYMKYNEFDSGLYVNGEVCYSIGFISKYAMNPADGTVAEGAMYLVPVGLNENGNEKYIGVYVNAVDFSKMDKITDDTRRLLLGYIKNMDNSPTLVIQGKLKKYTPTQEKEIYKYMKSYLGTNSTAECSKYIVPYYIDAEEASMSNSRIRMGSILLAISTLIIIIDIINKIWRKNRKEVSVVYNPSSSYNDSIDFIEENEKQTVNDESAPTTTSKFKLKE